jgi:UDP-glucose 4-epimerase
LSRPSALVLGGTGFIGRHLLKQLEDDGWRAFAAIPSDRTIPTMLAGAQILEVAALNTEGIAGAVSASSPDVVFNLVASGVKPDDRDEDTLTAGNVGIVRSIMAALRDRSGVSVIHAGSWSEYPPAVDDTPITEDHPLGPSSPYGKAKAAATRLGMNLARELGIEFTVLRLFNVYGPGEATYRLIPYLVDRLNRTKPADLTEGTQIRDFVYVADVARGLVMAAGSHLKTGTYNLASGKGLAVRDLALLVADALGAPRELLRFGALPRRWNEPGTIIGNPARFEAATGWVADTPIEDGVRRTIEAICQPTTQKP